MPATITTLDAVLKEFYGVGLIEEINNEVQALELFEKGTFDWAGKRCYIPVHVARNTGVGWNVAGTLPAAGQQTWEALLVTAHKLYGRFQLAGDAIEALGKGGENAFVNEIEAEMDTLKEDLRDRANESLISGGRVIGFMSQQNRVSAGPANWMFDGDFNKVNTLVAIATPLEFRLIRMSDKRIHPNPIAPGSGITSANASTGTVAVNAILDTTAGAGGWNAALVAGDIYAVEITGPAAIITTHATRALDAEPRGVYSNLGQVAPWGVSAATHPAMRATGFTTVADGGGAAPPAAGTDRVALDLDAHLQMLIDRIFEAGGSEPDVILTSIRQRSRYAGLLAGTTNADFANRKEPAKGDGGFTGFGYAGIPIKVSRSIGSGHWMLLTRKSWRLAELSPMKFADKDGAILSRVANTDAWEGFVRWYVNFVCARPNHNGLVTGVQV